MIFLKYNKIVYILIFINIVFFSSCSEEIHKEYFGFFLGEPCMIVNYEQDNTVEGDYLTVKEIFHRDSLTVIKLDLPDNFYVNNNNCENWMLGWGKDIPLYDAGTENIRQIIKSDLCSGLIYLGSILRGSGYPLEEQRVVFWNKRPSGFYNYLEKPVISTEKWPEFNNAEVFLGAVEFDSSLNKWIMFFNEAGDSPKQIYAAYSENLTDWSPFNNGNPVFKPSDFKNAEWAGTCKNGIHPQTPYISDVMFYDNKWYFFMFGYCADGKRHIGLTVSENQLTGPFKIYEQPLISPGKRFSWENRDCLFAKVKKYNDQFIMFYLGKNSRGRGNEAIGMAMSKDLINWSKYKNNPVLTQNSGWRSCKAVSEPVYLEIRNDSILLMVLGAKKFKMGFFHNYITGRMYMDKSGNVDKNQAGVFLSVDGGKSFVAHQNNPVFINDFTNKYENEHLGGGFSYIKTEKKEIIFYQAKSSYNGLNYNIMKRQRTL